MKEKWCQHKSQIYILFIELIRNHNGTKFKKKFKLENFQKKSHSRGKKCQTKENNNREAIVVSAEHVVKLPNKRMRASIYISRYLYVQN